MRNRWHQRRAGGGGAIVPRDGDEHAGVTWDWTPRELRHSFASLLSYAGVPLEAISHLVGHSETSVTELIYRHQIRPVIQAGAKVMDALFRPPKSVDVVTQLLLRVRSLANRRTPNHRLTSPFTGRRRATLLEESATVGAE